MLLSVDVTNSQGTTKVMWFWSYHNFIHRVVTSLLSLHSLLFLNLVHEHFIIIFEEFSDLLRKFTILFREGLNLR
jgi:hypothetical protein